MSALVKRYPPGKVILASDLCCRSSFSSLLNRKTLNARCNSPVGEEMCHFVNTIVWLIPTIATNVCIQYCRCHANVLPLSMFEFRWQFFLLSAPILLSFSSIRIHISASNWTCFSSRLSMLISGILTGVLSRLTWLYTHIHS